MGNTILILVSIIVFFAGFGVASVVYYNSSNAPLLGHGMTGFMTSPETIKQMMHDPDFRNDWANLMIQDTEHMNQMMKDPNFRNEWMNFMIQDTEHMNQWMQEDPQHVSLMIEKMKVNHDFMMGMAVPMIQDPGLRLQLLGHMTESPEVMAQMQQMIGGGMIHDETTGHDDATMGMSTPPQTHIVSIAEASGVPGCEITDECYLPYSLEIWVSDIVSWKNVDSAAHTVTSGSPNNHDGNFDSGMMMVNQSWEFTFTDSGEYDYYCVLHPWMTGKIIVNEVEEMIVIPELSDEPMDHEEHP